MPQKPPVRHHLVNKAYLRRFARDEQLACVRLTGQRHLVSVNDATVQKHFYSTELPDLEEDAYEKALSQLEGDSEGAFKRVVDQGLVPADEDRVLICQWIAAQFIRTKASRRAFEDIARSMGKLQFGVESTSDVRERLRLPATTPDAEVEAKRAEMLATADTRTVNSQGHLTNIAAMLPGLTNLALGRPWVVTRFERKALATSDTPVALIPGPEVPLDGVGFGSAEHIFMPLSRRVALMLGPLGNPIGIEEGARVGTARAARLYNEITARNARELLLHHPDDDPLAGIALPEPSGAEIDVSHEHVEALIEAFAKQQGRTSGLPAHSPVDE
ncbi:MULTISPECIES: DUF4238 domain-containing protein [unclassified Modestobacter]|uniref:DUF4238 domain-containing protein n=1 Tax=unclassified Modestobacter TaxID=2643866 RepID=UPI0022AA5C9E|nr:MULTISPECIES: DUF4238 domain-containing protein [unclassified Modestobacter]MCZ2826012.1 DUF4238 domain-containing protein [Modestobacter sp. VKM Ac-2981]MCZ2852923.1 DUF4238 domain-containing protein [Modestobacter sp. VKM Ac-2982]